MFSSIQNSFKLILVVGNMLIVNACSNLPSPHLAGVSGSLLQTRVAILPECPVTRSNASREGGGTSIVNALVAPLIDTAYATLQATVEELAEEKTKVFTAQTVGRFYETSSMANILTASAYELVESDDLDCIVVVHGYFSNEPTQNNFGFSPAAATDLKRTFGLSSQPLFYFEGSFVYSKDSSGFRVRTEALFYDKSLIDHKNGMRNLKLELTFSKPSASNAGVAFAVGEIDLGMVNDHFAINGAPLNGYVRLSPSIQTSLGTGYLPLPALDDALQTNIDNAKSRTIAYSELINDVLVKLKGFEVSGAPNDGTIGPDALVEFLDVQARAELEQKLSDLNAEIGNSKARAEVLMRELNSDIMDAEQELEDLLLEEDAEQIARLELERAESKYENELQLAQIELEMAEQIKQKAEIRNLLNVSESIIEKSRAIALDGQKLGKIQPFMINVALTEVKPENRFWSSISSVLEGAKEGVVTAAKEKYDPIAIAELEEQKEEADKARLESQDSAKKEAITKVLDYKLKELELEALPENSAALDKMRVEKELAIAELDASVACRDARSLSVDPPGCSAF